MQKEIKLLPNEIYDKIIIMSGKRIAEKMQNEYAMRKLLNDHEFIYNDPITSKMRILSRNNIIYYSSIGDINMIKILVENGVEINSEYQKYKSHYPEFPLMIAAKNGHFEVCKFLLDNNANPNIKDTYFRYTPLMYASKNGHFAIVRLLVERGATVYCSSRGYDAFNIAFEKDHMEIYNYLKNPSLYYVWVEESLGLELLFTSYE